MIYNVRIQRRLVLAVTQESHVGRECCRSSGSTKLALMLKYTRVCRSEKMVLSRHGSVVDDLDGKSNMMR